MSALGWLIYIAAVVTYCLTWYLIGRWDVNDTGRAPNAHGEEVRTR